MIITVTELIAGRLLNSPQQSGNLPIALTDFFAL
jgi:hypothetical protein